MAEVSDMELVRNYDRQGSEEAFAELVRRHLGLVYSAAFRQVGMAAQAEEIAQVVFVILARKAGRLHPDTVLAGWLYETTRLTAGSFQRGERRRQWREQEAYMQSTLQESTGAEAWTQLAPLLDDAMAHLGKKDRDAVVLRYFQGHNLRDVAAAMKTTEAAAQSRVHRAVDKLRKFFTRRGVTLPAAALTLAISAHSVQAAPAALAGTVTALAITKGAAAGGSTLTLIQGALKIMAWTKVNMAVTAGLTVLFAAGTATVVLHETVFNEHEPVYQGKPLSAWLAEFDPRTAQLSEPAQEAVRQMGTNSLPFLFRWLHVENDGRKNAARGAVAAYGVLNSTAAVQIPELTNMLTNETNLKPIVRASAASALGTMGTAAEPAVPALVAATKDAEDFVRNNSYWALGRIQQDPEVVVPVLIRGLNDSFHVARENAANGLAAYGTNATIALPGLEAVMAGNAAAAYAVESIKLAAKTK